MANNFSSTSVATSAAVLKIFYADKIVDQLNEDMPLYKAAEKVKNAYSGSQVNAPVRVQRNQGIGAGDDGGTLPAIGRQGTVQAVIPAKYNWLRAGITAGMIKASQKDVGAFVRDLDFQIRMGYKDFANDFNRQLGYDGTGYLAQLNAAVVASNTLTVIGRDGSSEDGDKFLAAGMMVDIVTSAGVYKAQGVQINSRSSGAISTVVLNTAVTAANGDYLVRSGSYNKEVQGLLYSLDGGTSTIYSVDRSTYDAYQGNVINLAGAQLTIDQMHRAYLEGLRRGGTANGKYNMCLMDFNTSRFYSKLLTADKRYVNTMNMDGGSWKNNMPTLEFNGIPLVVDKDTTQRVFFIPSECLTYYILSEMEIADESGSNLIPQVAADSFEIRFRMFGNLFNNQPAAFGVVRNYISP